MLSIVAVIGVGSAIPVNWDPSPTNEPLNKEADTAPFKVVERVLLLPITVVLDPNPTILCPITISFVSPTAFNARAL